MIFVKKIKMFFSTMCVLYSILTLLICAIQDCSCQAVPQPYYLNRLLINKNYKEFSNLTKVPENIVRPVYVDREIYLKLASQEFADVMLQPWQYYLKQDDSLKHCNGRIGSLWERYIPYAILPHNYTQDQRLIIQESIRNWNHRFRGLIEFREKRPEDQNYVIIFRGNGCFTHLGKLGGVQAISLKPDIPFQQCLSRGWTHHELMHVVGMMHTNNRPDRNLYLNIIPENVPYEINHIVYDIYPDVSHSPDKSLNFTQILVPYEYNSVMHIRGVFDEKPLFSLLKSNMNISLVGYHEIQEMTAFDEMSVRNLYAASTM